MKKGIFMAVLFSMVLLSAGTEVYAQTESRHELRAGNRKFRKGKFKESEIDYRKALLKDSTSVAASYNLASALYRQEDYDGAGKALEKVTSSGDAPAQGHFNAGDVALQKKDYAAAVKAFRESLLLDPDDMEAKENYVYAKKMLENQQGGGGGQGQDNNGGDQNQNQDQNQNGQQPPRNDGQDDRNDQGEGEQNQQPQQPDSGEGKEELSQQQARQMLRAVQAKEKETMDKVNEEKAALLKSKQKEKNW